MSPFMSSMPAAGLIEMPPVSKHTPLPMKATGASPALAAVPAHHHDAALARRALADAEQRVHAELLHRLEVEHLDRDADFFQHRRAAGEFFRIEHVGRLVDEIARHQHAAADRLARRVGLARGGDVADRDRHAALGRRLLVVLALGLVAVEGVGAQHARRARGRRPARPSARRSAIRRTRSPSLAASGSLPMASPPSLSRSFCSRPAVLPAPITTRRATFSPSGTISSSAEPLLPVKRSALAARATRPAAGAERLGGGRAEFEPVVAEHDENARWPGRRRGQTRA